MVGIAEYVNALEALDISDISNESEEENEINIQFLMQYLFHFDEEEEEENNMQLVEPAINGVQRINHVKIVNYVEHVVRNYINHDFIMHFRLSRQVVNQLIIRFEMFPGFTNLRVSVGFKPITSEKHILCYLWFVGHQTSSYRDVADRFGITLSCLYNIITRVTNFILSLVPTIIKYPTQKEKEETKDFYFQKKGFPGIIGSIDGSHIRVDKPLEDKDSYINRKHYFSIQLQGIVNHKKQFIDVVVGYPGSVHDARVFRESSFYNDLPQICADGEYILADSAYPCLKNVMVPYRDNGHLNRAQIKFNTTLSSCHVTVENAFADLKQRFRQLYHFKLRNIVRMVLVIHACCVLHNLANADDLNIFEPPIEDDYPDPAAENFEQNEQQFFNNIPENGKDLRDELCRQIASRQN